MSTSLDLLSLGEKPARGHPAVASPGNVAVGHRELRREVARCQAALDWPAKALVIIHSPRHLTGLLAYLAALASGHAVMLVEDDRPARTAEAVEAYAPELVVTALRGPAAGLLRSAGYVLRAEAPVPVWQATDTPAAVPLHQDLGLVARTSGSVGAAKTVRISFANLSANAVAIAEALSLRGMDRSITALPMDFSFGLSIVNSALAAGGGLALAPLSPSGQMFWRYVNQAAVTCVAAVPSTWKFLRARGWDPAGYPGLRLLLHAGGALDRQTLGYYHGRLAGRGAEFVSMYGQTEATARIACLRAAAAAAHLGSSGTAVPGGRITIETSPGIQGDGEVTGEIVFQGPNVMMGYAVGRADLALGDVQGDVLRTGDLGYLRDGYLYVTGRADRQIKILGRRIDLDAVEHELDARGVTAAAEPSGEHCLMIFAEPCESAPAQCQALAAQLGLPAAAVRLQIVDRLPVNHRGKPDRAALRRALPDGVVA